MTTNPTSNPIISGEAGRGGENALGVTQIHWDFESCMLRNVGKDEASRPWIHERARATRW